MQPEKDEGSGSNVGRYTWLAIILLALVAYGGFRVATYGRLGTIAAPQQSATDRQDVVAQRVSAPPDRQMNEIKLQRLVRSWVVAGLKDPDSAKFRHQYGVCGEVNAKNAMGGYVGYRRFIAVRQDLVAMDDGISMEPREFQKAWGALCDSSPTGSKRLAE